jgi:hypothetical protein
LAKEFKAYREKNKLWTNYIKEIDLLRWCKSINYAPSRNSRGLHRRTKFDRTVHNHEF